MMKRIRILLLIIALMISAFPASILGEFSLSTSSENRLLLTDAEGNMIHEEALESFRFQVSGLDA